MKQKNTKNTENTSAKPSRERGLLAPLAGALLLAAGLFAVAAMVTFVSFGKDNDWGWGFVVLGICCLVGWFLGRRGSGAAHHFSADMHSRKRLRLGIDAVVSVVVFFGALVFLNYVASRHHKVFDLTKNRGNSLSDQTYKVLAALKKPVTMTYIWLPTQEMPQLNPQAQAILEAYRNASSKVQVEYVNAAQDQLRVQQLQVGTFNGMQPLLLVEEQGDAKNERKTLLPNRQEVAVTDEQNITSALIKLGDTRQRVVYFLTGHGEATPAANPQQMGGPTGLENVAKALTAQNYALKELSLISRNSQIPSDAAAVIVVRPQVDLMPAELDKFKKYLAGKGRLVLLLQMAKVPLTRWKTLLSGINIDMFDGLVLERDPSYMLQNPQQIIAPLEVPRHALLRGVAAGPLFPEVVPLKVKPAAPGATAPVVATPLFETSASAEALAVKGNRIVPGPKGPLVLAAAVEKSGAAEGLDSGLRVVVAGNATFASDTYFNVYGNTSFFLSAVNWVAGNDALVSIPPKDPVTNTVAMTLPVQRLAVVLSLFTVPFVLLMVGFAVWWKRR